MLVDEFSAITDENIIKNYHPDYRGNTANIFHILDTSDRYKRGCYYVVENDGEFVCSAGWNEYGLDNTIALALTRAYVAPKYRGTFPMAEHILPQIIEATAKYREVLITVNDYNATMYQAFVRAHEGKHNTWPEVYGKFKPAGIRSIYYTQQYVAKLER
jgi:hypothetical protein